MRINKNINRINELIINKKGYDIVNLDIREISNVADFFIICSAASDIQVKAIADEIINKLSIEGIKCFHKEGFKSKQWILLDYSDIVVHIFRYDAREFYNLEKLWGDAKIIELNKE